MLEPFTTLLWDDILKPCLEHMTICLVAVTIPWLITCWMHFTEVWECNQPDSLHCSKPRAGWGREGRRKAS